MLKTYNCGDLRKEHANQFVTLAGWVNRRRDMGGVIFVDIRDRSGKTQVVVDAPEYFIEARPLDHGSGRVVRRHGNR